MPLEVTGFLRCTNTKLFRQRVAEGGGLWSGSHWPKRLTPSAPRPPETRETPRAVVRSVRAQLARSQAGRGAFQSKRVYPEWGFPPLREHVLPPVSGDGSYVCLRDLAGSQGLRAAFPLLPSWKRLAFPESRPVSLSRSTQNIIVFSPVCPSH